MFNMQVETKFLVLVRAAQIGDSIDGWRVGWVGGWDKRRVVFYVMVERINQMQCTDRLQACSR
jgi:hypothetical protein